MRALAFCTQKPSPGNSSDDELILASGSQDGTIRLWNIGALEIAKYQSDKNEGTNTLSDDLLDAFEASLADHTEGEEGGRQISLKRHVLTVKSKDHGCVFLPTSLMIM